MKVLIVDDEAQLRNLLTVRLEHWGYSCRAAGGVREAESLMHAFDPDLVLSDVVMPEATGMELLRRLRGDGRPVVLMTAHGSIDHAVDAMKEGAVDFLTKPLDNARLQAALEAASANLGMRVADERARESLVGESSAMLDLRRTVALVASSGASALITGESGTGKEVVARAIHDLGSRASGPWVAINAAAIPESLVESELFGHERGAFTGAVRAREGCFEQASGGTLFLDELAEMPMALQPKLLRALESGHVRRLGAARETDFDVRVLAATNRPPAQALEQGLLREDLYYRLNVFEITVPPLRERPEDVPPLARHFVREFNAKHGMTVRGLRPAALECLRAHHWPGNVRELRNLVERAVVVARTGWLEAEHFPPPLRSGGARPQVVQIPVGTSAAEAQRQFIQKTLEATGNNKAEAARRLGVDVKTIRNKLK